MTPAGGSERIAAILRRVAPSARRDDGRPAFLDGLLLGAMVGAAIAGSTAWSRRRTRRRVAAEAPEREEPRGEVSPGGS
ncbi:MAG TPA: hypothetical protein VJ506_00425 [Candidatus Limnocylindrales bacterium]|nr:hypothetical protein [Candidatus Limnocylindrales bacterium]